MTFGFFMLNIYLRCGCFKSEAGDFTALFLRICVNEVQLKLTAVWPRGKHFPELHYFWLFCSFYSSSPLEISGRIPGSHRSHEQTQAE